MYYQTYRKNLFAHHIELPWFKMIFKKGKRKSCVKAMHQLYFVAIISELVDKKIASANDLFSKLHKEYFGTDFFLECRGEVWGKYVHNWRFFVCPIFEKWAIKKNHYLEKSGKIAKKNFYQTFVPQNHCCDSVPEIKGHIKNVYNCKFIPYDHLLK